jgi:catechol 2,3-dioxygenase-like lactoylglutathione lyase family enzyme
MPHLTHIHHVQLAMPQGGEGEARAFYGIALGLTEVPKPDVLKGNGGVWFESGALRVHLGVDDAFHPARKAHPAFMVDDLAGLRTRLRDLGHEVVEAEPLDGLVRCHVFDPFGNRIELMEKARLEAAATDEDTYTTVAANGTAA